MTIETTYFEGDLLTVGLVLIGFFLIILAFIALFAADGYYATDYIPALVLAVGGVLALGFGAANFSAAHDELLAELHEGGYSNVEFTDGREFVADKDGDFGKFFLSETGEDYTYEVKDISGIN